MARRHGGLGRGLDALIPMREEVEKAMKSAESEGMEILFADDEDFDESGSAKSSQSVSRETLKENTKEDKTDNKSVSSDKSEVSIEIRSEEGSGILNEIHSEEERKAETKTEFEEAVGEVKSNGNKNEGSDGSKENLNKDAVTVRISEVEPNRSQPRKVFDDEKLAELAESIKTYGLLQPILVQKRDGYYEIIAGERRWRAALKAGLKEIPVIIREYSDKEILELSLIENIQREDLNPIEEAQAYKRLMDEFDMSQADVAQRVSKSRSAVANSMRLLKLDEEVQKMLTDGQISMGHARALLPLESSEKQVELAGKIVDHELSVRATEKLVKEMLKANPKTETDTKRIERPEEDPSIAIIYKQIEERLQQTLHTKVSIQRKRNGHGKLQIDFYNSDDLEKIIDRLTDH